MAVNGDAAATSSNVRRETVAVDREAAATSSKANCTHCELMRKAAATSSAHLEANAGGYSAAR